ncbi:MAG: class I SAM-dependent methyltransferase [Armatimonadetes bacterium]|nr:class I SAM-dependent methyltransferase [Armatimonadota bacterium]
MFGAIAGRYDLLNTLLSFSAHKWWRRVALRRCALRPGMTALDVGAGTADMALGMAARVGPEGQVLGVDFCEPMLRVGARKVAARGLDGRVRLLAGDAQALPLADGSVDAAVTAFVLRNVTDVPRTFREMARVTRPGGMVVSLELSRPASPLLRRLYYLYFYRVLPRIGGMLSRKDAYTYLPNSLTDFHSPEELAEMMRAAGLEEVRALRLTGGIVAVHAGRVPGGSLPPTAEEPHGIEPGGAAAREGAGDDDLRGALGGA